MRAIIVILTVILLAACGSKERDRHRYSYTEDQVIRLADSAKISIVKIYYNGRIQKTLWRVKDSCGATQSFE